jgi:hypothetical protein
MNVVLDSALPKNGRSRVIEHGCERGGGVITGAGEGASDAAPVPAAT